MKNWFNELYHSLIRSLGWDGITYIPLPPEPLPQPQNAPVSVPTPEPNKSPMIDTLLPWNTVSSLSHENFHNVRVLCDLEGLSLAQKNELCATIWGESEFNTHAKCINYAHKNDGTKYVSSIDNGICQWNDYYHSSEITPEQAVNDPEKAVRLMCKYWIQGRQDQWVAHRNGRYKQFLGRTL